VQLEKRVGDKVQGEGWVETRDGREERGEGYRLWMEERREVREQTRDGREEGSEGRDEGWKRGGR